MGWRLLNDSTSLWSRVLRSKYKAGDIRDPLWLIAKSSWSSTWRSVCIGLREGVLPGVRWIIGNGRDVKFWTDPWLSTEALDEIVIGTVPAPLKEAMVRELWQEKGGWNLQQIAPYVTEDLRLQLSSLIVDTITGSKDRISWGGSLDGRFTVKSAYCLLSRDAQPKQHMGSFFDRIWQVRVPERVRLFFWLTSHQALMTNAERQRRHLCISGICDVCRGGEETILHILRDCPAMAGIWTRLVSPNQQSAFFAMSLLEWLYVNLGDIRVVHDCPWAIVFAIAAWWGWKWRCGNVFGVQGKCRDRVKLIKEMAKESSRAHDMIRHGSIVPAREERMICWIPPLCGWFKLNTDGASRGNPGLAAAGGVIRDGDGTWCGGFALNIGICSAPLAELWGVYYGLCIAWEKGIMRLDLEVDSEIVVGFLKTGIPDSHPLSFLVRLCYGLISKDWLVRISHVYREANRLADGLANYAFTLPLGLHPFTSSPESTRSIMLEDASGVAHPRFVRM